MVVITDLSDEEYLSAEDAAYDAAYRKALAELYAHLQEDMELEEALELFAATGFRIRRQDLEEISK